MQKILNLNLLLTSRPHLKNEINNAFVKPLEIEIGAVDSDLAIYISKRIQESDKVDEIDDCFRQEIISKIIQKARRMYVSPLH